MRRAARWVWTAAGMLLLAGSGYFAVQPAARCDSPSAKLEAGAKQKSSIKPEVAKQPVEPADNSYCFACHANYQDEKLAHKHQLAGVGCEKCHGQSVKHSGDEDNITPPDKMYAKDEINRYCLSCHEEAKLRKTDDHKEWFVELYRDETCNECHGKSHKLHVRTRVWDKRTGKLLSDDGVRMMSQPSAAPDAKKPAVDAKAVPLR